MAILTDLAIRQAKPRARKYTMSAGKGLTLLVMPDGAKYWRLRYRFGGKPCWITLGKPYPETSLRTAENEAFRLRRLIDQGRDPRDEKVERRVTERQRIANTFGMASEAWYEFRARHWDEKTSRQVRQYLDKDMLPKLRTRPLDSITAPELGALVAGIEKRDAFDVAKKVRQWLRKVFSYARANGWTTNDPAKDLAAIAAAGPESRHYAHLPIGELPGFLNALDADTGSSTVKACARLALLTANRPGVTRTLRWSELDLDSATWTIQKGRKGMKLGYRHITPLPTQAVALLKSMQVASGSFEFVFVGRNDPQVPISDGAVAGLFKRIGYHGKQTMHGFRHLVSTALNEMGYEPDWVERQLAHGDPDKVRGTYNKAHYLDARRKMMQDWADYVDRLQTETVS